MGTHGMPTYNDAELCACGYPVDDQDAHPAACSCDATCTFMDEAADHAHDGTETDHAPHDATPDFGQRIDYEDGDIVRHGYECITCHHTTEESGRFHTDPRLDR